jgi:adenosylhomocysteine nucleosidase
LIGIICAMQQEVDGFLRMAETQSTGSGAFSLIRLGQFDAVIASCGLGKVNAAMTASILIERWDCRALVSAGTAGGLGTSQPMQVVIGTELVQHDYGRSRGIGQLELYRPGVPPLPEFFSADVALRVPAAWQRSYETIIAELDYVRLGTYASGDTFVNDEATRARLVELGAIAVDMECAAVAQVAEFHQRPWLVAKGISDGASNRAHDDFLEGLAEASRRSAEVVRALLPILLT